MSSSANKTSRLLHIDALKAFAAQLIVLHHLAAYGPIADAVQTLAPQLISALYHYGRMAVQVFLVVGGFLSARALSSRGQVFDGSLFEQVSRRYLRLTLPFLAAVLLTLFCSALVSAWLPELVPASVSLAQLLAHATLLHGVLGFESLTVGAWYVAVDFQLFGLLLLLLWLAPRLGLTRARARFVGPALILLMCLASLFIFNRDSGLDNWAPYYFGAYGLGALVHYLGLVSYRRLGLYLISAAVLLALLFDFRERIALALMTACLLAWLQQRHQNGHTLLDGRRAAPLLAHLGTHSYSLFLVHFSVCLLVNGLFEHRDAEHGTAALLAAFAALLLSNLAAIPFHRWIEAPSARLRLAPLWARLLPKPSRS